MKFGFEELSFQPLTLEILTLIFMIRDEIKKIIKKAIKQAQKKKVLPDFGMPEIHLEHPEKKSFGDYSTNVAMLVKPKTKNQKPKIHIKSQKPIEIAKILGDKLRVTGNKLFDKVEVAGPGFINFTLSEKWLQEQVWDILRNTEAKPPRARGGLASVKPKVQVEFISANPTGPLHLGHGRGAFAGDTLANVLDWAGFKVEREYYINDAKKSGQIRELGKTAIGEGSAYLNDDLRLKIKNQKSKIKNTIQKLKSKESIYGEIGYLLAQEIHKDIRGFIQEKLKIKFDKWVSEEKLYQGHNVSKTEEALRAKGLVYEKEGATWLETSRFGDDKDRVLIKHNGQPTYLLPDIAYHKRKFKKKPDRIIDIWGADHLGHIKPLKIGLEVLGHDSRKLEILISQMVRLKKEGKAYKMSKRKGEVVDLGWLIDEVGLDVTRFLFLMKTLDTQMEFDLDLAKERSEKNPVFYVQYASARIHGILAELKSQISNLKTKTQKLNLLKHSSELDLVRQLIKFPEIVGDTSKDYQVQRLPRYSLELASCFHYFYKCCRVISEDKDLTEARLALVLATKVVLGNVLKLMGIHAPKRM